MPEKIGMYGGSFDPLHTGHVQCIEKASGMCDRLYVVLSHCRVRDHYPVEIRYRWLMQTVGRMKNVQVILLEDAAPTKEAYDRGAYWEEGRDRILSRIGAPVDVVFCGSDYHGTNRYETLYGCEVICFDRGQTAISSSAIRENPLRHWDMLPEAVRPYFVRRIALVGGESTGKSTLTRMLAAAYGTNCLEEVGRSVCDYAGTEDSMIAEDFHEILLAHKAGEIALARQSRRLLFVDTEAVTTRWYSGFLLTSEEEKERIRALAEAIIRINRFDLVLFLEPTVPFVQDGTRNERIAADRLRFSEQIKSLLRFYGVEFICLDGDYSERFERAKQLIRDRFGVEEEPAQPVQAGE